MMTLIIIAQSYTGALAYEHGPFPDEFTCQRSAKRHIAEIKEQQNILHIIGDCRLLHPELADTSVIGKSQ